MTSEGVGQLSNMLLVNHELQYLVLNNNEMDVECMKLLCDALERNEHLEYLYLNNCDLKDESIESTIKVLGTNKTLKSLEMVKNHLTEDGKMSLNDAQTLNSNCAIYLDFTFHYVQ